MQIIDTFSGIGGFSIAGDNVGWKTILFCEINPFCQGVLKNRWPNVPVHDNIKTLTFEIIKNSPLYDTNETTIFVGGIPCQPWSLAGKRRGVEDDRNLWPESIKLISEIKPRWAVLENVPGFINWSGGLVFEQVQADLEAEGYEVQPYVLPACGVGAPHRRDRVWFVAHGKERFDPDTANRGRERIGERIEVKNGEREGSRKTGQLAGGLEGLRGGGIVADSGLFGQEVGREQPVGPEQFCEERVAADTNGDGHELRGYRENRYEEGKGEVVVEQRQRVWGNTGGALQQGLAPDPLRGRQPGEKHGEAEPRRFTEEGFSDFWKDFPLKSPICRGNDGLSGELVRAYVTGNSGGVLTEKEIDGIVSKTFSRFNKESIKSFGNAIVPQVAEKIFMAINEYEKL